jgi:hypothetical protein
LPGGWPDPIEPLEIAEQLTRGIARGREARDQPRLHAGQENLPTHRQPELNSGPVDLQDPDFRGPLRARSGRGVLLAGVGRRTCRALSGTRRRTSPSRLFVNASAGGPMPDASRERREEGHWRVAMVYRGWCATETPSRSAHHAPCPRDEAPLRRPPALRHSACSRYTRCSIP